MFKKSMRGLICRLMRPTSMLLVALCICGVTGCASALSRMGLGASHPAPVYQGAILDGHLVFDPYYVNYSETDSHPDESTVAPRLFSLVDFPFSFVLDTLCLPYDIVAWVAGDSDE